MQRTIVEARVLADETAAPTVDIVADLAAARPRWLVIEPRKGWRSLDLAEIWRYRELLAFLTWRDVTVRYKQTVLGAAWAVIQPVLTMLVFSVFFGHLGGMSRYVDGPYPLFVFAALVPWTFFSQAVAQSAQSLINGASLVTKVYFPRLIIPWASAGGLVVDFLIALAIMFGLMALYGVQPTSHFALLPLLAAATLVAALGVGTLLAALAVSYRDFRHIVPFLLQIWMFASPVAYPYEAVPPGWRQLYALNPMAGIISGYRSAFLGETLYWDALGISTLAAVAIFWASTLYFRRAERRFADIV